MDTLAQALTELNPHSAEADGSSTSLVLDDGSRLLAQTKRAAYDALVRRVRDVVAIAVPPHAVVAVVSKGDEALLDLDGRPAWHFPRLDDGRYAGYYPATDDDAIAQVRALRAAGAQYLVLPATARWWLDHYAGLHDMLDAEGSLVWDDDRCCIYGLAPAIERVDQLDLLDAQLQALTRCEDIARRRLFDAERGILLTLDQQLRDAEKRIHEDVHRELALQSVRRAEAERHEHEKSNWLATVAHEGVEKANATQERLAGLEARFECDLATLAERLASLEADADRAGRLLAPTPPRALPPGAVASIGSPPAGVRPLAMPAPATEPEVPAPVQPAGGAAGPRLVALPTGPAEPRVQPMGDRVAAGPSTIADVREVVAGAVPAGALVAVVSTGEDALVELDEQPAWHFPCLANGRYTGQAPRDDADAIAQVEAVRAAGARYLVFPPTAFWWRERYGGLHEHLDTHYRLTWDDERCRIYELASQPRPDTETGQRDGWRRQLWRVLTGA